MILIYNDNVCTTHADVEWICVKSIEHCFHGSKDNEELEIA